MDRRVYLRYYQRVEDNYAEYKVGTHGGHNDFAITFRGHCLQWSEGEAYYNYIPDDPNGYTPLATGLEAVISFDDAADIGIAEDMEFLLMQ